MTPREILEELDRLGVTVWWQQLGADQDEGTTLQTSRPVPPDLRAAIDEHTGALLKIMHWEPSKQAAGIRIRKPRTSEEGSMDEHGPPHEDYGRGPREMRRRPGLSRLNMAEEFLREILADGPKVREAVFREGWSSRELSAPLIMKARATCGVREVWAPELERYLWELIEEPGGGRP